MPERLLHLLGLDAEWTCGASVLDVVLYSDLRSSRHETSIANLLP